MATQDNILLSDFLNFDIYPFDEKGWEKCCTGQNEKQTLIFLPSSDNNETKAFLSKIFGAVKFDLERDTLICQLDGETEIALQSILKTHTIQKVIFFGVPPKEVALYAKLPIYRPIDWNNLQLLQADNLSNISKNKQQKGALWKALQEMFL